jgi:transposase
VGGPRTTDLRAVLNERVKGRKRHLLVDTLGMVVARRVEAANVSDRRVGARLLAGLQSGFAEDPDGDGRCRLREPQVGARAKTASRVGDCTSPNAGSAPSKVVGLTWIVERTFAWLARNRRLSKDYLVEGSKLRKPSSTWRPSASCSNGSPRGKTSQTPSELISWLLDQGDDYLYSGPRTR